MRARAGGPARDGAFASVLRNGSFVKVLTSDAISGAGDVLYWVGLIVLLLEKSADGALVAAAVAARLVPRVAFGALGGVVADRYDRRRLLTSLDAARAGAMFLLAAVAGAGGSPILVLALVFVTCSLSTPYRPAISAGFPRLVAENQLAAANALSSTVGQVSALTGPLLGTVLLLLGPPAWCFVANGLTYAASALIIRTVPGLGSSPEARTDSERPSFGAELSAGFRIVRTNAGIAALMLLIGSVMLMRGFELVLHVQIATVVLDLGPSGFGIISAALGAGAIAAVPLTGRMAAARSPGLVLIVAVILGSLPLGLLAFTHHLVIAVAILVLQGGSIVCFEVLALTLIQRTCRPDGLGRVLGIQNTFSGAAKLTGSLLAPLLVVSAGLKVALIVATVLVSAIALQLSARVIATGRATTVLRDGLEPYVVVLARLGVLDGASRPSIERLAMHITVEALAAGTVVVQEGDPADDFFVIREGEFDVSACGERINELGPDDWFGELGLLRRARRTATVTASTPALVWRVPGDAFIAAVTSSGSLSETLTQTMTDRLARTDALNV